MAATFAGQISGSASSIKATTVAQSFFVTQSNPSNIVIVSVACLASSPIPTLTVTSQDARWPLTATIQSETIVGTGPAMRTFIIANAGPSYVANIFPNGTATMSWEANEFSGLSYTSAGTPFTGTSGSTATIASGTGTPTAGSVTLAQAGWSGSPTVNSVSPTNSFSTCEASFTTAHGTTGGSGGTNVNVACAYIVNPAASSTTGPTWNKANSGTWMELSLDVPAFSSTAPDISAVTPTTGTVAPNGAVVTWSAATGTVQFYRVERSVSGSGLWSTVGWTASGTLTTTDTGAGPGNTYIYQVVAVNPAGTSTSSSSGTVTTPGWTRTNTFEGGTVGTAITTANSGGASGDGFDAVQQDGSNSVKFASLAKSGTKGAQMALSAGQFVGYGVQYAVGTSQPEVYGRAYIQLTTVPVLLTLITYNNGFNIQRDTAGHFIATGTTTSQTSTGTYATGTWFRLEWHVWVDSPNFTTHLDVRIYTVIEGTSPAETLSATWASSNNIDTTTTYGVSQAASASATVSVAYDDLGISSVTWLGPSVVTTSPTRRIGKFIVPQ